MKKTLVAAILGLAATASVMAQGRIVLDNYTSGVAPYATITYGANSGGTLNTAVLSTAGFTVGIYYSLTSATFTDPSGTAVPGGTFVLATGTGSTAAISADGPGLVNNTADLSITPNLGVTAWFVLVAYKGGTTYADPLSTIRGHSAVFTVVPNNSFGGGTPIGPAMAGLGFQVIGVPEPSTFALAGVGLAGLLIFRRRK